MIKRLVTRLGIAAVLSVFSMSSFAAVVTGSFSIDSATIIDLYSATFDGALNPSCVGAADVDECNFFSGQTPAGRAITVASAAANTASGTLNVDYDNVSGEISQINSMLINLPDAVLTIAGTTIVTVTQGNAVPTANDTLFIESGTGAPNGTADADESAGGLTDIFYEHDDAPNLDAPDFSTFNDIVDSCTGGLCGLIGILSLDGVRYRILGDITAGGGDSLQLQTQTGNNSIYKVNLTTAAVPVPAAVWLFGSALGLLGWMRRRVA